MKADDIIIPMDWRDIDWLDGQNQFALEHLIRQVGVKTVLEIGALFGRTTLWFAERVDHVTSIDPWYETAKECHHSNLLGTLQAYNVPRDFYHLWAERIEEAGMSSKVTPIRGISQDPAVARRIPDESMDLLYIDGDHSYESCLSDIEMYMPKVRIGGVVCGDDYIDRISTRVREAVDERLPQRKTHGQFWWTIKE